MTEKKCANCVHSEIVIGALRDGYAYEHRKRMEAESWNCTLRVALRSLYSKPFMRKPNPNW